MLNKKSALTQIPKASPNFERIMNIYSVNNYKKKKYVLLNNSVV